MLSHIKNLFTEKIFTHILFISLFFFIVVADLNSSFQNAKYIYSLQSLFCLAFIFSLKNLSVVTNLAQENKHNGWLLLAWFFSVLISFVYSNPFSGDLSLATTRLMQSYMHVLFFLTCWYLFLTRTIHFKIIFYIIILTSLIVVSGHITNGYLYPLMDAYEWFYNPPFNSHIRHTGYQIVVSICLLLVLIMEQHKSRIEWLFKFLSLSLLLAFLFWLGGRGATVSVYLTVLIYFFILIYKKKKALPFIATVIFASVIGFLLSEYAVLYPWNGLSGAFTRSESANSINSLSSGRITIWLNTWEVYKDHVFWGLGPQGFLKVANDGPEIQPHNIFLQFLIEWGLIGTVIFLALLIKGFYFGVQKNIFNKNADLDIYTLGAGGVIVALSFHALFDGTYYHPQPSLYLAFAFALWVQNPMRQTIRSN